MKKISSTDYLLQLITAFKSNDTTSIDKVVNELISDYEKKGNYKIAKKLREINALPYTPPNTGTSSFFNSSASLALTDAPLKLFEMRHSKITFNDIILSKGNQEQFLEIKNVYQNKEKLLSSGLPLENKILIYGPPGTGKTLFAYVLAGELHIPVLHVYLDILISSYLGETGKNIKAIFSEARKQDCIIFLDEFDAIAKKRDDGQELGELKRVVNVLLQNMDELEPDKMLIAVTNHDHLIDKAIRRRFTYELHLNYLDKEARKKLFDLYLTEYGKFDNNLFAELSENLSGAHIKRNIYKALRRWFLDEKQTSLEYLIIESLATDYFSKLGADSKKKENDADLIKVIKVLREYNSKKYTYKHLESLLNISDSTIQYLVNQTK